MKELLITGAWRCGEQQVQALEQMGYARCFITKGIHYLLRTAGGEYGYPTI